MWLLEWRPVWYRSCWENFQRMWSMQAWIPFSPFACEVERLRSCEIMDMCRPGLGRNPSWVQCSQTGGGSGGFPRCQDIRGSNGLVGNYSLSVAWVKQKLALERSPSCDRLGIQSLCVRFVPLYQDGSPFAEALRSGPTREKTGRVRGRPLRYSVACSCAPCSRLLPPGVLGPETVITAKWYVALRTGATVPPPSGWGCVRWQSLRI